jgi:SagB-type dehydrogenase family enzyme
MLPKIAWVFLPLALYAAWLGVVVLRGRPPARHSINMQTSLLLIVYLLTTAGLGIFWVANQQLPVFDIHYLFGYATLIVVSVHLFFNFPAIVRWLERKPAAPAVQRAAGAPIGKAIALLLALGFAFYLGSRHGAEPGFQWTQGGGASISGGAVDAVVKYHEYSSESRSSVFKRAPGVEWGAPPAFKSYPDARRITLETGRPGNRSLSASLRQPLPRKGPLTVAELGELLYLTAGVTERRGGHALRASPSSGALFPNELYVLARRVDALAPGIYHYDPERHALEAIAPIPSGFDLARDADALVFATTVFRRTGHKYRNRAYRYAVADTGHLLENLRVAGHAAGLGVQPIDRFDESEAARAIGVDGVEEGVMAVLQFRAEIHPSEARMAGPASRFAPAAAPGDTTIGVTGMVHRATSLARLNDPAADLIALPAAVLLTADVHRTITSRRSQRRFSSEAVPLATLSSMLADMSLTPQLSDAVNINLVVNRVEGLAPGVYRYLPQHALRKVRAGRLNGEAQAAALNQDVIGEAAVVLVLSADRERMLAQGARGYRQAFLEAGMLGERWLLGAVAHGLGACPVGAFYDDEAAALLAIDPRREWVLHFAALGMTNVKAALQNGIDKEKKL